MDDIVRQAIAKWPNVPHCYGWLGLDARGNWYMRDDRAQAEGPFAAADGGTPQSRGSLLKHDKLIDFIQRNYEHDAHGQWFFQNGPQRVYVELEATPFVWRIKDDFSVVSHAGEPAMVQRCLVDERGYVYLECNMNGTKVLGLVHTQDVAVAAEAVTQGQWTPVEITSTDLPEDFGFVRSPMAPKSAAS
jgi:hypothetical protein